MKQVAVEVTGEDMLVAMVTQGDATGTLKKSGYGRHHVSYHSYTGGHWGYHGYRGQTTVISMVPLVGQH